MITSRKFSPEEVNAIISGDAINSYDGVHGGTYFLLKRGCLSNTLRVDDVQCEIIDALLKDGWQIYQTAKQLNSKRRKGVKDSPVSVLGQICGTIKSERIILFYEKNKLDIFAVFNAHSTGDKLYNVILYYPNDLPEIEEVKTVEFLEKAFRSHIKVVTESKFYILIKDEYGDLSLRAFETKVPQNMDLGKSYGKEFEKVHKTVLSKINEKHSGLYVFHGAPGTGKSTYIKYLAGVCTEKKFVYVPEFMVSLLNQPDVVRLLMGQDDLVLVIEDAEKIIQKREGSGGDNMVATLLNFTDGILSDILKLAILLTYNTNTEDIDAALLRKGRLQYKYEFQLLTKAQSIDLMKHSGLTDKQIADMDSQGKLKDHMTLADIFNISEENGNNINKKEVKIGFDRC